MQKKLHIKWECTCQNDWVYSHQYMFTKQNVQRKNGPRTEDHISSWIRTIFKRRTNRSLPPSYTSCVDVGQVQHAKGFEFRESSNQDCCARLTKVRVSRKVALYSKRVKVRPNRVVEKIRSRITGPLKRASWYVYIYIYIYIYIVETPWYMVD